MTGWNIEAEYLEKVKKVLDEEGVVWPIMELNKVYYSDIFPHD